MMRFILQRCPACLSERTIDKLDNPDLPKAVALVEERCADCEPDGYEEWFDAEGGCIPPPLIRRSLRPVEVSIEPRVAVPAFVRRR